MIVTEIEAQKKMCPGKVAMPAESNRCCLGSRCMGWRWADNGKRWCPTEKKMISADGDRFRAGFCGRSGVPVNIKAREVSK